MSEEAPVTTAPEVAPVAPAATPPPAVVLPAAPVPAPAPVAPVTIAVGHPLIPFMTNPLVAFIRKNFVAVIVLLGSVFLALAEASFGFLGQLAYAPALIVATLILARILRTLASRSTTGAYTDQLITTVKSWDEKLNAYTDKSVGNFTTDFHALDPKSKVWITVVDRGIALIAIAIIVQHLWK